VFCPNIFGGVIMRRVAVSNDSGQPARPPTFHAVAWVQRSPDRKVAIADLHEDCESFDDLVDGIVVIDGVRYICFAVHAFDVLPPYRKDQLVELVVTEF
jgi:hypothetical protein